MNEVQCPPLGTFCSPIRPLFMNINVDSREFTSSSISGECNFLNCTVCSPAPSLPAALPLPNGFICFVIREDTMYQSVSLC